MNESRGRVKAEERRFHSTEKLTIAEAKRINDTMISRAHLKLYAANVAACMGTMAVRFGEDREHWEAVGYLHDYDYEKLPKEHLLHTERELLAEGVPAGDVRATLSHSYGYRDEVEPKSKMEKSLYTVDELGDIIQAAVRMCPNGIADMDIKSFMRKFKSRGFAAKCSCEIILKGYEMLDMDIKEVAEVATAGIEEHAEELQFTGNQA